MRASRERQEALISSPHSHFSNGYIGEAYVRSAAVVDEKTPKALDYAAINSTSLSLSPSLPVRRHFMRPNLLFPSSGFVRINAFIRIIHALHARSPWTHVVGRGENTRGLVYAISNSGELISMPPLDLFLGHCSLVVVVVRLALLRPTLLRRRRSASPFPLCAHTPTWSLSVRSLCFVCQFS